MKKIEIKAGTETSTPEIFEVESGVYVGFIDSDGDIRIDGDYEEEIEDDDVKAAALDFIRWSISEGEGFPCELEKLVGEVQMAVDRGTGDGWEEEATGWYYIRKMEVPEFPWGIALPPYNEYVLTSTDGDVWPGK